MPCSTVRTWVETLRAAKLHQPLLAHPSSSPPSPLQAVRAGSHSLHMQFYVSLLVACDLQHAACLTFMLTLCRP